MSFAESFEVYAKARLRQIIAELTIDGSARRLVDYSTMLLHIEEKGIRRALYLRTNTEDELHEQQIFGGMWQRVTGNPGHGKTLYSESTFKVKMRNGPKLPEWCTGLAG
jgi:hypothetical protein